MLEFKERDGTLTFAVRVAPRASQTAAGGVHDGALKVRVAAPPVEGAANAELARFLAKSLDVPARAVEIVGGHASKTKLVRVAGARPADLLRLAAGG
ncbi:MAG: DUF167 domain-containing protein [Acidobacteria bacterium]|nr:DUF167 domain-containing protein [Acidobacteriota bacterium]